MALGSVTNITNACESEIISENVVRYFDDAFVIAGGFINVDFSGVAVGSADFSNLEQKTDPNFPSNTVWQGQENWIYNSGDITVTPLPNVPVQVEIDGSIAASPTIDYRNGRVIAPSTATSVRAQYSYRWVSFSAPSYETHVQRFNAYGKRHDLTKANDQVSAEIHRSLPAVSFDFPSIKKLEDYGLGRTFSKKVLYHDIIANVYAEKISDCMRIADIFSKQQGYSFCLYCPSSVGNNTPLNFDGSINTGHNFNDLINNYAWLDSQGFNVELYFDKVTSGPPNQLATSLFHIIVKIQTKMVNCACGCN